MAIARSRGPRARDLRATEPHAQKVLQHLPGEPPGAKQERRLGRHVQHGGLDPHGHGPGVEDHIGPPPEVLPHAVRIRGTGAPAQVGAGRRQREPGRLDQGGGDGMVRHPESRRIEPPPRLGGDDGPGRKHQGQGAGPEGRHEAPGPRGRTGQPIGLLPARQVQDQRVVGGPPLRAVDAPDRIGVQGVRSQPVDGLRRKGDQPAAPQNRGGLPQDGGIGVPGIDRDAKGIHAPPPSRNLS